MVVYLRVFGVLVGRFTITKNVISAKQPEVRTDRQVVWLVSLAFVLLAIGGLIYIIDRPPEHVYLMPHAISLYAYQFRLPGQLWQNLPSLVHVCAFILLTYACFPLTRSRAVKVCIFWFVLEVLFEVGQLSSVAHWIASELPDWFNRIPLLDNIVNYFRAGIFDWRDVVSIFIGTMLAFFIIEFIAYYACRVRVVCETGE